MTTSAMSVLERRQPKPLPPTDRPYTADELLEFSTDSSHRYELRKGNLTIMAPAGSEHGHTTMGIGARLRVFSEEAGIGLVFAAETGFKLESDPDTVLAPDVAFVRRGRLPAGRLPTTYFPGPPDLAVEVVSPGDTAPEVQDKVQQWLRAGSKLVWVVEPRTRTVTVFRPDGSATVLQEADTLSGEDIVPGFSLPLSQVFRVP